MISWRLASSMSRNFFSWTLVIGSALDWLCLTSWCGNQGLPGGNTPQFWGPVKIGTHLGSVNSRAPRIARASSFAASRRLSSAFGSLFGEFQALPARLFALAARRSCGACFGDLGRACNAGVSALQAVPVGAHGVDDG